MNVVYFICILVVRLLKKCNGYFHSGHIRMVLIYFCGQLITKKEILLSFHEHVEMEIKMQVMTGNVSLLSNGKSDVFSASQPFCYCCGRLPSVEFWENGQLLYKLPQRRILFTHKRLLRNICMDGKCQSVPTILPCKSGIPGLCMYLNAI